MHLRYRADGNHLTLGERGDAVANRIQALQVMRDHEHGETQRLLQGADQLIEIAGGDRVQP